MSTSNQRFESEHTYEGIRTATTNYETQRKSRESIFTNSITGLDQDLIVAAAGTEHSNEHLVVGNSKRVVAFARNSVQQMTDYTRGIATAIVTALEGALDKKPEKLADFAHDIFDAIRESSWSSSQKSNKAGMLVGYVIEKIKDKDFVLGFAQEDKTDGGAIVVKRGKKNLMLAGGGGVKVRDKKQGVSTFKDTTLPGVVVSALSLQKGDKVLFVGNNENLDSAMTVKNSNKVSDVVDTIAANSAKESSLAHGAQYGYGSNFGIVGTSAQAYQYAKEHPKRVLGIGTAILAGAVATAAIVYGTSDTTDKQLTPVPLPTVSAPPSPTTATTPNASLQPSVSVSPSSSTETVETVPAAPESSIEEGVASTDENSNEADAVVIDESGDRYVYVTKWDKDKPYEPGSLYNISSLQLRNVPDYEKLSSDTKQRLQGAYTHVIKKLNPSVDEYVYIGDKIKVKSQAEVNDFVAAYVSKNIITEEQVRDELKSKSPNTDTYKTGYQNIGRLVIEQTDKGLAFRLTASNDKFSTNWGVVDTYLSARYARESLDIETLAYTQQLLKYNDETWETARNDQIGEQHLFLPQDRESAFFKTYPIDLDTQKNPYDFLTQNEDFMKWAVEHPTSNPYAGSAIVVSE